MHQQQESQVEAKKQAEEEYTHFNSESSSTSSSYLDDDDDVGLDFTDDDDDALDTLDFPFNEEHRSDAAAISDPPIEDNEWTALSWLTRGVI